MTSSLDKSSGKNEENFDFHWFPSRTSIVAVYTPKRLGWSLTLFTRAFEGSCPLGLEWKPVGFPLRFISPSNTCNKLMFGEVSDHFWPAECSLGPALDDEFSALCPLNGDPPRLKASKSMPKRSRLRPRAAKSTATMGI